MVCIQQPSSLPFQISPGAAHAAVFSRARLAYSPHMHKSALIIIRVYLDLDTELIANKLIARVQNSAPSNFSTVANSIVGGWLRDKVR